jgi:hypothetical protein
MVILRGYPGLDHRGETDQGGIFQRGLGEIGRMVGREGEGHERTS